MEGGALLADRYEVRGVLGCGGMAEVRDGWDTRLQRPVAVKLLLPAQSIHPDIRRRFEDEARAAATLNHPNIVLVHDFGDHQGTPFIVMERLPGVTLADRIAQGPLAPTHVRAVLNDVLSALAVAHNAGILHRDIKPGNILVSATGNTVKVADFGIAKTAGAALTMTGQIVGTMAYMSPERIAGAPASVADDLYAVGVVGYEALAGHRAFPHDNPAALAHAVLNVPPPPLAMVRPDLDPALAGVVDRAMKRDPGQRFGSADQMRAAFARDQMALFAGVTPVAAAARPSTKVLTGPFAPSATQFVPPPPRRRLDSGRRKVVAAAAVFAALILAVLGLALDPSSSQQAPHPISTSTPVPTPTSSPPPPSPASPTVQSPQVEPGPGPGGGHKKGGGGKHR
ncbi:serine/threonine-protein kinase [Candidatus Mycolicibacterium alkanivorans]|uniref:non-specific serine/threonine protein kinase n=1 Tax=Candidatus Mycolicibacterium alkanivorans TaxID=2954114 RepID=A0ABS9YWM3_9MYCO|nr:serine/threonine-protein kinase [Candidatus Mycolicibacterium alkanivorans]MCI4675628.1 serine/threonine protein kinase [Candidatus Mycolicibacterium alkanivorans]